MAIMIVAAGSLVSCSKESMDIPTPEEILQNNFVTFGVNLRFDAPGIDEVTLSYYDEDGVQVASENIIVPTTSDQVVSTEFLSETTPSFVTAPGLQNVDGSGLLRIPSTAVQTKGAAQEALLLVIRR